MVTRNVVLTDHQSAFIDETVSSGQYQNASEVMRAGVRLLEQQTEEWQRVRACCWVWNRCAIGSMPKGRAKR